MKEVNESVLRDAANRLLFDMSDEEYKTLLDEFDTLIVQLKLINNIPGVDNEKPMTFPYECSTAYLREDVPGTTLTIEEVLRNTTHVEDNQIKLPKVVK